MAFERRVGQSLKLRAGQRFIRGAAGPDELTDDPHPSIRVIPRE